MKAKTLLELMTLSTNLYLIAKDKETIEKIKQYSEKGKDAINDFVKEKITDSDGNELEFVEKLLHKLHELKDEMDQRVQDGVEVAYNKLNITHTKDLQRLEEKVDALSKELSLANSRIEALEAK